MKPPHPVNELARLEALRRYEILDSATEQAFDDLTALAAHICRVPISLISLVDADRQWFKSRVGIDLEETSRDISFCGHAILEDDLFVVPDAFEDARFADSPLVLSDPEIRFYAGRPLVNSEGHALGALCVMDRTPRELTDDQVDALNALGRQTVALLEQRRAEALLHQEIGLVDLLRETAGAANEAASVDEALVSCLELVCRRIAWPVGHAYVVENVDGRPRLVSTGEWHLDGNDESLGTLREATEAEAFRPGEGLLGLVLETGRPLWIADLREQAAFPRGAAAAAAGLRAAVFVPVLVRREVAAVLEFYSREPAEPNERVLDVMGNLGTQLGRVVERERAERALSRRLSDLRAVLDATAEAICLSDRDGTIRFVNTAMETLWRDLGLECAGSIWSQLQELAQRSTDPAVFAEGVRRVAAEPGEPSRSEFELTSGRSFLSYSVPVGDGERLFVFRETSADRAVERLKDEFLASVSHELRTPLTSILGYSEALRSGDFGPLEDEQIGPLEVVERNAARLNRLVDDLLLTARLEAKSLDLSLEEVDLASLAVEAVQVVAPRAESQGVRLVLGLEPARVDGDGLRLRQLLDNLVSNAVKFTPDGGTVTVSLKGRGGRAVLEVADTGIGVPEEEQDRLFERFYRTSVAREQSIDGTGLGLVIAKAIAESHGGRIGFESQVGRGTTFRVELPLRVESPAAGLAA